MSTRFHSTISVAALQQDAPAVLDSLQAASAPTAVTRGKGAAAVLMSIEVFERKERERQILLRLAKGEMEIAAGKGYDFRDVLADAEKLLSSTEA